MEKVLQYTRAYVKQDTGYYCGPASTQTIILSATGTLVKESTLAGHLRTHTGGTDYIGQFPAVLNRYISGAKYRHADYPAYLSSSNKDKLWADIVGSVNAGHGVVANFVAPPSNYPRAVYPSTISPSYRGGTVYHYVAVMGYSTATKNNPNGTRKLWIADSGFSPYGYWLSFDQFCSLIVPKGVAYSTAPAKVGNVTTPVVTTTELTGFYYDEDWAKRFHFGNPRPLSAIEGICLHTTENSAGTPAKNVAKYQLDTESGSYHVLVDSTGHRLRENTDGWRVHASGNMGNDIYLHLSFVAYAGWSRAEWLAQMAMLEAGAKTCAHWCRTHNIPVRQIEAATRQRGFTTHDSTRRAWGGTDHTDPGKNFPWDVFLPMVTKNLNGKDGVFMALTDAEQRELLTLVRDLKAQLTGDSRVGKYSGWSQLGGRTLVDGVATIGAEQGIDGFKDLKGDK